MSENIGKKTNQCRVLNSFSVRTEWTETGAEAKNWNSSCCYRKCLSSETFSCSGVSLKVSVEVSV